MLKKIIIAVVVGGILIEAINSYRKSKTITKAKLK
jgi:hypothetical protein